VKPVEPDFSAAKRDPRLITAALALHDNRLSDAEPLLRQHLKEKPFDVAAIRMLAELAGRIGRYPDAETLLRRAVELAPGFTAARSNLATVLYRQNKPVEAIEMLADLQVDDPANPSFANLKAAALGRLGEFDEAIQLYETVLDRFPKQAKVWMSFGHVLKTVGRQADAIAAYRRALDEQPGLGEVWWSLANLKTVKLGDADIAAMQRALDKGRIEPEDRFHLDFALGKAFEDCGDPEQAFAHYDAGNKLRRARLDYSADDTHRHVERTKAYFTPERIAARAGQGCPAPDPIFILGLPRAGSTLIEQILSSHSQVEGTMELPDIPVMVQKLRARGKYPECLSEFSPDEIRTLGESYLETTRIQRKTGRPFFIDKLPNNWIHVGLIRLILPNARIIDARRHPLGSCFSNFKQHFAKGQPFAYGQEDIGRYYADYVDLMRHFEIETPIHIHRVIYECMVDDTEAEVRALLAALDLPFEEACLRFYENDRAVRTASSEQVRRPIFRDGAEGWQAFDPWLGPMKTALGPVLENWQR
jgi:tetratricopeptide (TPR) repeat protein